MFTAQRRFDHIKTETSESEGIPLTVIDTVQTVGEEDASLSRIIKHVYVNPGQPEFRHAREQCQASAVTAYLQAHKHGQVMFTLAFNDKVPQGSIALTDTQRLNAHVCLQGVNEFFLVLHRSSVDDTMLLSDISFEVRPRNPDLSVHVELDASPLRKAIATLLFSHVIAINEQFVLPAADYIISQAPLASTSETGQSSEDSEAAREGDTRRDGSHTANQVTELVLRTVSMNSPISEEDSVLLSAQDISRGVLTATTTIYIASDPKLDGNLVQVHNQVKRDPGAIPKDTVIVHTNDEEWFPVKKRLLVPCITLTKQVRDQGVDVPEVHIEVDCLTFDRVIIYLEHEYSNTVGEYDFDLHLTEPLLDAARILGCRGLQELCERKLGEHQSRIREHAWADVMAHNARGGVWLCIDGMIFDVERWLDEHPGGNKIIPKQALGVDATVFFELYHSSRESFLYLKQFYIGEVREADRDKIPLPKEHKAHPDFYQQLREYTVWRLKRQDAVFKSF
eukprot:TRINITY_DN9770_c0_g1_i1.p1 TRINITY_DN9770_c0_g1~~TRINITY_DN9770_c0_g1_i1.p1  ORF type:complete len:508 (-),score=90.30 TRINITY_DN9770_c0_g1_i1:417-1940(-)